MKVHVVIRLTANRPEAIAAVIETGKLKNVNRLRADRHGIVSGDIDDEAVIDRLRALPDVQSVDLDQTRRISGG